MRRLAAAAALLTATLFVADRPAWGDDKSAVVARVGKLEITASDLEKRLAETPPFQLATFGKTPDEIRRKFLEEVMIPAALHAEEARATKLDERSLVRDRIREVLRQAIENELREELASSKPPTDAEIKKYYDDNRSKFHTPRRLKIWRILVDKKDLAQKIIADVKAAPADQSPKKWGELARKHSADDATKMREGNLGFVRPDGTTNMPRVKVARELFEAAEKVKDGELVPEPVAEGERWAVVWRRGSIVAVTRTLEQEENSIKQILTRSKLKKSMTELLDGLEKKHVSEVNDELLRYVNVLNTGDISSRRKPGTVPRRPARSPARPRTGERGNR